MHGIKERGLRVVAQKMNWPVSELQTQEVSGGFSRNRRALVGYGGDQIFAKQVDIDVLDDDDSRELAWLKKITKPPYLLAAMRPVSCRNGASFWTTVICYCCPHTLSRMIGHGIYRKVKNRNISTRLLTPRPN